ncbi:MAG: DUF2232 domain-containing protein [Pseudomonadota bacterium]
MTNVELLKPKPIGIGALIAIFLYLSGLFVLLTPLPLLYVSATSGRKSGVAATSVALITLFVIYFVFLGAENFQGDLPNFALPLPGLGLGMFFPLATVRYFGLLYFLFFGAIALALAEGFRQQWGLVKGGSRALIGALVFVAIIIFFVGVSDLVVSLKSYLEFIVAEIARVQSESDAYNTQTALFLNQGPQIAGFVLKIFPAIIFVLTLFAVVINQLLFQRIVMRKSLFYAGQKWEVAEFRMPDNLIWVLLGSAGAFLVGQYVLNWSSLTYLGLNVLISFTILYFFQGLSIVAFFVRRIKPLFRVLFYLVLIFFFQFFAILIIGLGLAEVWVNFRQRFSSKEQA